MYDQNTLLAQRSAFSDGDLATASPARVLVKCFDRLDADLDRALTAIDGRDHETTNRHLGHAQDLLGEVASMLDRKAWEHADSLLAVYDYVLRLIAVGNIEKHVGPVTEARRLLAEIGSGFRTAADEVERGPGATSAPTPTNSVPIASSTAPPDGRPGFSVLA